MKRRTELITVTLTPTRGNQVWTIWKTREEAEKYIQNWNEYGGGYVECEIREWIEKPEDEK